MNTNFTIDISGPSYLDVCLHNSGINRVSGWPMCTKCDCMPLIEVIKMDIQCVLYYQDDDGLIKPIRPEMFKDDKERID